jgi:hypothetical protein
MQINLNCANCGFIIHGACITRVDTSSVDAVCSKCKAVYRISIIALHNGEPQDIHEQRRKYGYTYDKNNNRIPINDLGDPRA